LGLGSGPPAGPDEFAGAAVAFTGPAGDAMFERIPRVSHAASRAACCKASSRIMS
jgi:hypothetical protein